MLPKTPRRRKDVALESYQKYHYIIEAIDEASFLCQIRELYSGVQLRPEAGGINVGISVTVASETGFPLT